MKSKRLAFDFPLKAIEEMETLKVHLGLKSIAELIRDALKLYLWYSEKKTEGLELVMRDKHGETVVEFIF